MRRGQPTCSGGTTRPQRSREAIDHFVETGGVQYDDPDYDEYNGRIDAWVKAVCP